MSVITRSCHRLLSAVYSHTGPLSLKSDLSVIVRSVSTSTLTYSNYSTMAKPKVFVSKMQIPAVALEFMKENFELTQWNSKGLIPRTELLKAVEGQDGLFCVLTDKIDAELLDRAGPSLKVVSTMSVGYDHVDLPECKRRGIPVGFTPDVLTNATAELAMALLLATSRRLQQGIRSVRDGSWGPWDPLWMCGKGLDGATVGIVGLGRIGFAVAKRLVPFNVEKIVYCGHSRKDNDSDIPAEFVSFHDLLERSDFVIVCAALTKDTEKIMNADAFRRMKNSAMLVNISRGGLVDQEDLYEALRDGEIWGAGLDVTTPEPLPIDDKLLTLENCTVLPHIGSATDKTRGDMAMLCARNIHAALNGNTIPCQL